MWAYFDKTYQGLAIAGAAAVGGPIIEIVLINVFHLYTYTNPDILEYTLMDSVGLRMRRTSRWQSFAHRERKITRVLEFGWTGMQSADL